MGGHVGAASMAQSSDAPTNADWPEDDTAFLAALARDDRASGKVPIYALLTARALHEAAPDGSLVPGLRGFLDASRTGAEDHARQLVLVMLERAGGFIGLEADTRGMIRDIVEAHATDADEMTSWRRLRIDAMSLADAKTVEADKCALEIASALAWPTAAASQSAHEITRLLIEGEAESAARAAGIARVTRAEIGLLYDAYRSGIAPETPSWSQFRVWFARTEPDLHRDSEAQDAFFHARRRESALSLLAQVASPGG